MLWCYGEYELSHLMYHKESLKILYAMQVSLLDLGLMIFILERNLVSYNWCYFNSFFVIFANKECYINVIKHKAFFLLPFSMALPHPESLHGIVNCGKVSKICSSWIFYLFYLKTDLLKNCYTFFPMLQRIIYQSVINWLDTALWLQRSSKV